MPITVVYQLREEDLLAVPPMTSTQCPTWPSTFYYYGIFPAVFLLVSASSSLWVAVTVVLLVLFGGAFTNDYLARFTRKAACADPRFFDPITVRFDSETIFFHQGYREGVIRWRAFSNVYRSGAYIWFYGCERDSFYVPARAFASDEEANRFLDQANFYCAAAKQTETTPSVENRQ